MLKGGPGGPKLLGKTSTHIWSFPWIVKKWKKKLSCIMSSRDYNFLSDFLGETVSSGLPMCYLYGKWQRRAEEQTEINNLSSLSFRPPTSHSHQESLTAACAHLYHCLNVPLLTQPPTHAHAPSYNDLELGSFTQNSITLPTYYQSWFCDNEGFLHSPPNRKSK